MKREGCCLWGSSLSKERKSGFNSLSDSLTGQHKEQQHCRAFVSCLLKKNRTKRGTQTHWTIWKYIGLNTLNYLKIHWTICILQTHWTISKNIGVIPKTLEWFQKHWTIYKNIGLFLNTLDYLQKHWTIFKYIGLFSNTCKYRGLLANTLDYLQTQWSVFAKSPMSLQIHWTICTLTGSIL